MATFAIEGNGSIETTAVYYNGRQLGGIKEVFLNIDEEGTFDAIIQYEGTNGQIYNKQIFSEYLENAKFVDPSFTEDEAEFMQKLTVESSGTIDDAAVYVNEDYMDGIVSLFVHIKAVENKSGGLKALFSRKTNIPDHPELKAEITFRNDNGSFTIESVF